VLGEDWNVVVTVYEGEFREAIRLLSPFGRTQRTPYRNVLVMKVKDGITLLDALQRTVNEDASLANTVSRVVPVTHGFQFNSPEEFERKARDTVNDWVAEFGGQRFHVRMHRRGFKGRLSSQHEEQFLDHHLLEQLKLAGLTGSIDFENPDAVIAVETLGQSAGLSRWTREQLKQYEFLRID
jgi:tRNA(Ser,Leu) C12 N-acetylase TAN1